MTNTPLVSVILPVFNGEEYLEETIRSVLAQTYPQVELIVVDDGSSDTSADIIKAFDTVQYIHQGNQGVPFVRNKGAQVARGQFLAFIDQDDLWLPEKLRQQIEVHAQNPTIRYSITRQMFFLSPNAMKPDWCAEDWLNKPLSGYSPSCLLIQKTLFDEMGCFDTRLPTGSDTELFFQLKDKMVPFLQLDDVLVHKRVHERNQSTAAEALRRDIMETVRRSIHRQRTQTKSY